MSRFDLVVIGAGPAGAEAAVVGSERGLTVVVIDEAREAGGQVYRASEPSGGGPGRPVGSPEGEALRRRLSRSAAVCAFEHRVWSVGAREPSGFEVATVGPQGPRVFEAEALVVAAGAVERIYPRPGWTLPGVVGLGAATVMMKAHRVLPGRRVVVAGPGPLALLAATLVRRAGAEVAALVDPNPLAAWVRAVPHLLWRPGLLAQGAAWMAALRAGGVPVLCGFDVRTIEGERHVEGVTVGPVDASWRPVASAPLVGFEADAVCLGYGLSPATEIFRVLRAELELDPARGGWAPRLGPGQRTSVRGLYAAGDGAGLLGAAAAPLSGRLAALSAAFDGGRLAEGDYGKASALVGRRLARAARFGAAMARLMAGRAPAVSGLSDETVVCRCEDVTAGELRAAVREGAYDLNALKATTRCGMGPCGGRMCGEAAAALMECAGVAREGIGHWTGRPPLRPIPVAALTGAFAYEDIPLAEPAPL